MRADFWTKSPQQKLSDIGPKGSKKVKNCTKLVHFFTRDGRLRSKWTLFTLLRHYFKNTHSRHYVSLNFLWNCKSFPVETTNQIRIPRVFITYYEIYGKTCNLTYYLSNGPDQLMSIYNIQ